jgi:hypothetical protein
VQHNNARHPGEGTPVGVNAPPPTFAPTTETATTEAVTTEPAAATSTQAPPSTKKFGGTFSYLDGLSVRVTRPVAFQPSEFAMSTKSPHYVSFTITIVNKTGKTFDPASVSAALQSGDAECDEVFDSANGCNGSPSVKLLNGRQSTYKIGFGVPSTSDLVLDMTRATTMTTRSSPVSG